MEHIFFNSDESVSEVARSIFETLGVVGSEGDSTNVLNCEYFEASVFGLRLKIEENSYDFEDRYRYMLTVKRDATKHVRVRDVDVTAIARSILHALSDNMKIDIAIEVGTTLEFCDPAI